MVEVGTVIKSHDFMGRTDCYIIGTVVSINRSIITARVIKAVSEGKEYKFLDDEFNTHVQGVLMFDDIWPNRVEIVG